MSSFHDLISGVTGLWGLFISAFISSTLAPGGSEAVLAVLVNARQHPLTDLLAIATLGNTLGATTTWYLGLLAAKKWPADVPDDAKRHRAVMALRRYGYPALLLSWLPLIGDGLCFAAGWLQLSFWTSTLIIGVGKFLRYLVVALLILQF